MKTTAGLFLAMGLLAAFLAHGGCATWREKEHAEWLAACGPSVPSVNKPCSCEDPQTPGCPPLLNDDNIVPLGAKRADGGTDR